MSGRAGGAHGRLPEVQEIEQFLFAEARLLDEGRYENWVDLFADDGEYWVPAAWAQPDPLDHLSIFFEDRNLMKVRVNRLRHERTTTMQPPSRTVHQIGNVMLDPDKNSDCIQVASTLICVEYRLERQRVFAGLVKHRLKPGPGPGYRIAAKRVDLINCDSNSGHLRLNIPF